MTPRDVRNRTPPTLDPAWVALIAAHPQARPARISEQHRSGYLVAEAVEAVRRPVSPARRLRAMMIRTKNRIMGRNRMRRFLLTFALAAAALSAQAQGVTDTQVTLGQSVALSGPVSSISELVAWWMSWTPGWQPIAVNTSTKPSRLSNGGKPS